MPPSEYATTLGTLKTLKLVSEWCQFKWYLRLVPATNQPLKGLEALQLLYKTLERICPKIDSNPKNIQANRYQ